MHFDKHRSHGHVSGLPGVCYQQNGQYFDRHGNPVADPEAVTSIPVASVADAAEVTVPAVTSAGEPAKVGADDMRLATNKALKHQIESFGEEWQGVAHAKKFLGIAA